VLSRLAYYKYENDGVSRLRAALHASGFGVPKPFLSQRGDAQGFGTTAGGVAYVAFRGTQPDSVSDMLADARFGLRPWPGGGRVHHGFRDAFEALHAAINDWLEDPGHRDLQLVVTGHSLGAAMATIMAGSYPAASLVTFGSPRVGDAAFVARFAGRDVRRYVDCTDMVARVPPELLGYAHLAGLRYIDRNGAVAAVEPTKAQIEADRAAARLDYLHCLVDVWHNVPARDLADHAPINYVGALLGGRTGP
jgi:hypothetical protein